MRESRPCTGWIDNPPSSPFFRHELRTNLSAKEEIFGWLDFVSEVKSSGVKFLTSRGHGANATRTFLLFQSFIRQSKTFYDSAQGLGFRSSPLNYYYCFLNLVKAFALVKQPLFTGRDTGHGIRFSLRGGGLSKQYVTLGGSGVFPIFYKEVMGGSYPSSQKISITDLLSYCADIGHEYYLSGHGRHRGVSTKFRIAVDEPNDTCWALVGAREFDIIEHYKKSLSAFYKTMEEVDLNQGRQREVFQVTGYNRRGFRYFETIKEYQFSNNGPIHIMRDFYDSVKSMMCVHPYSDEFEFVLNPPIRKSNQVPMKEPVALYSLMYFLCSLVRYHPDFLESILSSRDSWIIERFIKSTPITLLLYLRNLIEGTNVSYVSR